MKQERYATKILDEAGMSECNTAHVPMEPGLNLLKVSEEEGTNEKEFRRNIGFLLYLIHTRPALAYSVGVLSHYTHEPKISHEACLRDEIYHWSSRCEE